MKKLTALFLSLISFVAFAQEDLFELNQTYSVDRNSTLYLETDDANIDIIGANRSDVAVDIYRKVTGSGVKVGSFSVEVTERGGDLYIEERSGSFSFSSGSYRETYEVKIEVPMDMSLDLEGDDDDYRIDNIGGSISLDLDDGDARITRATGSKFDFRIDDGDIEMEGGSGSLLAILNDGDLTIASGSFENVEARVDDGNIRLSTAISDYGDYFFKIDDGLLDLNVLRGGGRIEINHDDSNINTSGDFEILEKDEDYAIIRSRAGSAKIKIRSDDGTIRLSQP